MFGIAGALVTARLVNRRRGSLAGSTFATFARHAVA
jgi:hypothetical protein